MKPSEPHGSAIVVRELSKTFEQVGTGDSVIAIDRLSFDIADGEIVCIVGPNGCGKSTLFNILAGLERPTGGSVRVSGRDPDLDFEWFRGRLGIIFQEDRLLPWRTALENVSLGMEILGWDPERRHETAIEWLGRLGLERFPGAYPNELSGGMRQRVALARAFAINPEVLLADEAFSSLDEATAIRLRHDFMKTVRAEKATALLITHRLEEAIEIGSRVLVLGKPGRLVREIRPGSSSGDDVDELRREMRALLEEDPGQNKEK